MYQFRNSLFHCFRSLPQLQICLCNYHIVHSYSPLFHKIPHFSHRNVSSSPQIGDPVELQSERKQAESQLHDRFKKFARVLQKTGNSESGTRNNDLQLELKLLVEEIRGLEAKPKVEDRENKENLEKAKQHKSLNSVFTEQPVGKVTKSKLVKTGNCESGTRNKDLQLELKLLVEAIGGLEAKPKVEDGENMENLEKAKQHKILNSVFIDQPVVKVANSKVVKTGNSESETRNKDLQLRLKYLVEEDKGLEPKPKAEDGENEENLEKAKQYKILNSAFIDQPVVEVTKSKVVKSRKQVIISKVLSPDMETLLHHLYKRGYFDDADFVKGRFDLSLFEHAEHREYIKFVAERFGRDNQGLAKWLLGSGDLKQVVMLGCPNVSRRCVSPAKGLRRFFQIPEYIVRLSLLEHLTHIWKLDVYVYTYYWLLFGSVSYHLTHHQICGKCALKKKCKFANISVGNFGVNSKMDKTMKLITYYALESVHPQLVVPQEVKEAVSRLLKEVIKRT